MRVRDRARLVVHATGRSSPRAHPLVGVGRAADEVAAVHDVGGAVVENQPAQRGSGTGDEYPDAFVDRRCALAAGGRAGVVEVAVLAAVAANPRPATLVRRRVGGRRGLSVGDERRSAAAPEGPSGSAVVDGVLGSCGGGGRVSGSRLGARAKPCGGADPGAKSTREPPADPRAASFGGSWAGSGANSEVAGGGSAGWVRPVERDRTGSASGRVSAGCSGPGCGGPASGAANPSSPWRAGSAGRGSAGGAAGSTNAGSGRPANGLGRRCSSGGSVGASAVETT